MSAPRKRSNAREEIPLPPLGASVPINKLDAALRIVSGDAEVYVTRQRQDGFLVISGLYIDLDGDLIIEVGQE